jgi:hypothetical protein
MHEFKSLLNFQFPTVVVPLGPTPVIPPVVDPCADANTPCPPSTACRSTDDLFNDLAPVVTAWIANETTRINAVSAYATSIIPSTLAQYGKIKLRLEWQKVTNHEKCGCEECAKTCGYEEWEIFNSPPCRDEQFIIGTVPPLYETATCGETPRRLAWYPFTNTKKTAETAIPAGALVVMKIASDSDQLSYTLNNVHIVLDMYYGA